MADKTEALPHSYSVDFVNGHTRSYKYGIITDDGVRLTEPIFDKVYPFSPNGIALVLRNGHYGYINTKGEFFMETGLKDAQPFNEFGLAAIKHKTKWGIINSRKEYILRDIFDKIEKFQPNGFAIVKYENKYGLVDTLGNVVLPVIYDKIENFDKSGYAYIKSGNKIGVVDKRGRAIVPAEFKDKKSALAAVSEAKSKFGKSSDMTLAERAEKARQEDRQKQLEEKARREKEEEARLLAENKRKEEEAKLLAEQQRKKEEAKRLAEQARKEEDAMLFAKQKDKEKDTTLTAEQQRKEEEAKLLAEQQRKEEEATLLAEQQRKEEEATLLAEQQRKEEEAKLLAEQQRKEEEAKLLAEQQRKEEEAKLLAEQQRKEEEAKLLAEQQRNEEEKRLAEARKRLEETPTLKNYIAANLGAWNDYLASRDLNLPSEEEIRNLIEEEVGKWQVKGEFEPTARWKERVNETTRTAKINAMADSIFSTNSAKVEKVRAEYRKKYEDLADTYCSRIAEQFESQELVIKPYDADNETFLISTDDFGDFLLPVPLDEAPGFKQEWDKWKDAAIASFVPNGEDVALKSVKIGKYSYDSDMDATYAQVDVEYNFRPVDVAQLNRTLDAGADLAMNPDNGGGAGRTKGIQTGTVRISAGEAADIDINIPQGTSPDIPTFAVVIANGDYAHASKVSHAENDGRVMTQYLTRTLGIPESNVATFINATYGQMASAISMLQDIGDAYEGSDFNLMFYYVGHGLPDDEGKKSYILPVDIDPRQVTICMPLEKIYADLGNLGAKNVTVMVDACFSGTNHGEGMLVPQSMGVAMKPKKASPVGNMVVLTAADGNETAFPYEEKSHGLFTYWLLKKLQETSGQVTFGELSDYVIDNVKKTSVTVNRKPQTPTVATSPQLAESWRSMKFCN